MILYIGYSGITISLWSLEIFVESTHLSQYPNKLLEVLLYTNILADPSITLGMLEEHGVTCCYFNQTVLCCRGKESIFFLLFIYLPAWGLLSVLEWSRDIKASPEVEKQKAATTPVVAEATAAGEQKWKLD